MLWHPTCYERERERGKNEKEEMTRLLWQMASLLLLCGTPKATRGTANRVVKVHGTDTKVR